MDYVYTFYSYSNLDYPSSLSTSSSSSFLGHCSCTCFTCLYKLDLLLLLVVIYLLLMDKITININTSSSRLPLAPVNNESNAISSSDITNTVTSTLEPTSSTIKASSASPYSSSKSPIINPSSPWDSMGITNHRETLINSERLTPSDQPESLPDSLSSLCSYGSLRRKLIKPDISLDFLDSSSSDSESETESSSDVNSMLTKLKQKDTDKDSLEKCKVFSGCANDEHFYRDTSLSEETFKNERITMNQISLVPNQVESQITFIA